MTRWHAMALCAVLLSANPALAQPGEVTSLDNVDYVAHDGVKLTGDLYLPKGAAKTPLIIAIHGGGWQGGSPAAYQHWGP
jgi:acetyl esterase/lipase